jgi:hypothetical protein
MGEAALGHLDPLAVPADIHLATLQGVGVDAGLPAPGPARRERLDQQADHVAQVGEPELAAGDAPQVELVRRRRMEPVDRVAPVDHPGADEEHVGGGLDRQRPQRGRDHRGGVGAEQVALVHIAAVAHVTADRVRRDAEPVVVVLDRDHPRPLVAAHLAAPGGGEPVGGGVDEELDGVTALAGVGEVPRGQVVGELGRGEGGWYGLHGVSSMGRVGRGARPRPGDRLKVAG